jgi:hypothetical protein
VELRHLHLAGVERRGKVGPVSVEIVHEALAVRTRNFSGDGRRDLLAKVGQPQLVPDAEKFLRYVVEYLTSSKAQLRHGETIPYGYWLVKFMEAGDFLEAWEYKPDASEYQPGVTTTLTYWNIQHAACERAGAKFDPPRPDRLVVYSDGVLEGDKDVQGVRYPSPEHMSGWWLTTGRFDGNTRSLKRTHAYHLTAARPDLAHLIALPSGFRFDLTHREDIWFDEKAAGKKP